MVFPVCRGSDPACGSDIFESPRPGPRLSLGRWAYHFFDNTAFNARLSSACCATRCFNCRFSSSSVRSRLASEISSRRTLPSGGKRRVAHAQRPAQLTDRHSRLGLLQHPHDLLFAVKESYRGGNARPTSEGAAERPRREEWDWHISEDPNVVVPRYHFDLRRRNRKRTERVREKVESLQLVANKKEKTVEAGSRTPVRKATPHRGLVLLFFAGMC